MKVHLMHPDRDFDVDQPEPPGADDLVDDLGLASLWSAMARGDAHVDAVARAALLSGLPDPADIRYRQEVLRDCLERPDVVRAMYDLVVRTIDGERRILGGIFRYPAGNLRHSVEVLQLLLGALTELRTMVTEHRDTFRSEGMTRLVDTLITEMDDDFFTQATAHLEKLRFRTGMLMSARLDAGNRGQDYVLRRPPQVRRGLLQRLGASRPHGLTYRLADRDESGARAMNELRDQGLNLVANTVTQACDHVLGFLRVLRTELAFYVAALNLHDALAAASRPVCFPEPVPAAERALACAGLRDAALCLELDGPVYGNTLTADGRTLVVVTGANRGGKSTFLRSVGLAQLLMQAGLFVTADSFRASVADGIFTHYLREEDAGMHHGKLDEELARMSGIVDQVRPGSLLLCNESFSSTNEREGSQIAREIVRALRQAGVRVVFVTHLFDLAHSWSEAGDDQLLFLRAPRATDGQRTFQLVEGAPLSTSFGPDLYRQVFGDLAASA
jgi:hypothetical protein